LSDFLKTRIILEAGSKEGT